jgi:hypothetical protein
VPALRAGVRLRPGLPGGGLACYPEDRLFQEAAYIAYHFHWPKDEILDLTHKERHRWVEEISKINKQINTSGGGGGGGGGIGDADGAAGGQQQLDPEAAREQRAVNTALRVAAAFGHSGLGENAFVNPDALD